MIELFGTLAVGSMALFWFLERRGAIFTLLFAVACGAAALYAALVRAWPFAAIELLWAVLAGQRWWRDRPHESSD